VAVGVRGGERGGEVVGRVVVAAERVGDGVEVVVLGERFLSRGRQDGVRGDLEEMGVPGVYQGTDGGCVEDGLAEIPVPVLGGEIGAGDDLPGDGGVQRGVRGPRLNRGERVKELIVDGRDVGGVGRVVDLDFPGVDTVDFEGLGEVGDGGGVARDNCGGRSVDRGDGDGVAVGFEVRDELVGGGGDLGHGAVAGELGEELGA
jgi:hypothetical protein